MRVLIAPDCFTGTLTAPQAATALAEGWALGAPSDVLTTRPLSDGGPGFLDVVRHGVDGTVLAVTVPGPLGEVVPATVLLDEAGGTAYVEAAQAVGLHLVDPDRRDPVHASSRGLGHLVRAALDTGARRVVVGVGGTATNDGGAGVLAGLGLRAEVLSRGGGALDQVGAEDVAGLLDLRRELGGVDLVAAVDVDVPLLGLHGASGGFAPQKGASAEQAQQLERALGRFAHVVEQELARGSGPGAGRDAVAVVGSAQEAARARGPAQLPGAGAGGGVGFALAALGARLLPGAEVVTRLTGLDEDVAGHDLVVTGEGTLDWQSLHGKVVAAVADLGLRHGVPVVAVAGQVHLGRREWSAAGLSAAYAVAEGPGEVEAALSAPATSLSARARRVARTWSR